MKNLLYTFLAILVVFFVACEEDDVKPFEGMWKGTYSGGDLRDLGGYCYIFI